ncbi:SMR family transporter [Vitreoscilla massiliensis]|uniref:SMR family transporter n=1 Tax=Vitreoscilla massiliensis TaxID=1689272 RepID=A0ABY4E0H8_9NEIS|nr:SMR family transporter [Vitreoscilla massiliensis]UOO89009.1 SMR family transporter [Vitreoscilla massiliensis]
MQHSIVFIILIAAAMHASWNILIKRCGERIPLASQWVAIYCGIIAACVLPFMTMPASASWPYLLASAVLQAAYFFLLALAYRHGDFSVAYPLMRGVAPMLVLLVAYVGLGEAIDAHKIIGIVLICSGVLALLPHGHALGKSQAYALANAAVIASYTLIDGVGVRLSHSPVAYVMLTFVITALIIAAYCLWHERGHMFVHMGWREHRLLASGGALSLASYALALWSMLFLPIAVVSALRETSIAFGIVLAVWLLHEHLSVKKAISVAFIVLGVLSIRLTWF